MKKLVIIINGKGGVGKDTLCDMAAKYFRVVKVSSVNRVKEVAKYCGWGGEKNESSRKFLSDLKTLLVNYNDLPNNELMKEYKSFMKSKNDILFVHIRETSEIEKFKNSINSDCLTLLVRRNTETNNWGNPSDDNVENYNYDVIFDNNGTLEETETNFVNYLKEIIKNREQKLQKELTTVKVPMGTLIAAPSEESAYPGIQISLIDNNGETHVLSLLEYNAYTRNLRSIVWNVEDSELLAIINNKIGE